MRNDSSAKTLLVALVVSLVCSFLVSSAAVLLKPLQVANRERERNRQIREIVTRLPGLEGLLTMIEEPEVESQVIEFATGNYVADFDASRYDARQAAADPRLSVALPPEKDLAGIGRRAKFGTVHMVKHEGRIVLLILPVYGSGYASTLYGYLALASDANTVVALTFYEHGETPGMGAEIDDPQWRAKWQGKKVRDEQGRVRIGVGAGSVDPSTPEATYQVDGITGATQTGLGVTNLIRFWLGDSGFGPYLHRIQSSGEMTS